MPDARCTRSLVCAIGSKYAHEYSQRATGNHPAFPHAMVYGLYRALPGDRLSCHRHLRKPGSSAPGRADSPSANLTPASRRQDHTSSPSATNIVRQHAGRRPRETRPAIPCTPDAAASTATRPNVHDDGQRPSDRDGMAEDIQVIWVFGKTEYFFKRGWTAHSLVCPSGKSPSRHLRRADIVGSPTGGCLREIRSSG